MSNPTIQQSEPSVEALPQFAFGEATLNDLAAIALDALKLTPPFLVSSLLGRPWTWIPPFRRYSEYQITSLWRPMRLARYLLNVTVPSLLVAPPPFGPPLLNDLFWQPSVILQRPDHNGSYTSFPNEAWFFVNGILTNSAVAQINAAYLAHLFHRPITLLQNSTSSLWVDLLQCAIGKQWRRITEPALKAMPAIYDALKSKHNERVVVIAHSQGTIIMATVLDLLYRITQPTARTTRGMAPAAAPYAPPEFVYPNEEALDLADFAPLSEDELAKLEVYSFATCATVMTWFHAPGRVQPPIPWIEHFGNENDIVARLGMLAPQAEARHILLDGPRFMQPGGWGHLLNQHYLYPIEEKQRKGRKQGGVGGATPFTLLDAENYPAQTTPRLYAYLNGGAPA